MMRKGILLLTRISMLLIFLFSAAGCAIVHTYGPYYGKVIDMETKEPLSGAAVLAIYETQNYGPAGAIIHYLDAQETITNENGEFKIPRLTAKTFRIGHTFEYYPRFTIFKPGYGYYPDHKDVTPKFKPRWSLPAEQYVVVELPRLKTKSERFNMPSVNFDIPYEKQRGFIDLMNQEMEYLGATGKYSKESFKRR
jgi:hypothetical protein